MNHHIHTREETDCRLEVFYRIAVNDPCGINQYAAEIAAEQTVEIPIDRIPEKIMSAGIVGRVEGIKPATMEERRPAEGPAFFDVTISYRCDVTDYSLPQLLNVVFGNISLKNNIVVTGFHFPQAFVGRFRGPSSGVDGIRKMLGIYDRPLACTVLKPLGLPVGDYAAMAGAFARGGADLIKDDHGISNQPFHPFEDRVARCQEAISRANAVTGRKTVYCPTLTGKFDEIEERMRFLLRHGVQGVLVAPMLVGVDTVRYLCESSGLVVVAHPALTGTFFHSPSHGMTPAALLGDIFRLIGADVCVFPNSGGRFLFTKDECRELAVRLRAPMGGLKPAFPCPAGGMSLERIGEIAHDYGRDAVLLIGGALMDRSQHDPEGAVGAFLDAIRKHFAERLEDPSDGFASSCELPPPEAPTTALCDILQCNGFRWTGPGRRIEPYKEEKDADFKDITRQELIGKFGEKTSFDLRYFEIGPGGCSSFEKHVHEHVIIAVRGSGILVKSNRKISLSVNDIAYVGPLEAHRLSNETAEPFGFFCIVDHIRDRPRSAF